MWLIVGTGLCVWGIAIHNNLVGLQRSAEGAWSDLAVQFKRLDELVPALVESVKACAAGDPQALQRVREAHAQAMQATDPREKSTAHAALIDALRALTAVAEHHPQLQADEQFIRLQRSLSQIKDVLQGARRYYNAIVRDYNTRLTVFPDRLIAKAGKFQPKTLFHLEAVEVIGTLADTLHLSPS